MGNWMARARARDEHPVYRLESRCENLDHRERAAKDRPGDPLMRVVDDVIIGYWLGFLISSTWHSGKFLLSLPFYAPAFMRRPDLFRRAVSRLYWSRLRESAPMLGGVFAMWGLVFTGAECVLEAIRGKDDLYNIGISAGLSGFFIGGRARGVNTQQAQRARRAAAIRSGLFILVLITGLEAFGAFMGRKLGPFMWWAQADPYANFIGLDLVTGRDYMTFLKHRRSQEDATLRALVTGAATVKNPAV